MKRGQAWSLDLLLGVIIFMTMAILFYSTFSGTFSNDNEFSNEADLALERLDASNYPASYNDTPTPFNGYSISEEELAELYGTNYQALKSRLGVASELCIYITDQSGNLISMNVSGTDKFSVGDGSGNVKLADGLNCGQ